MNQKLIPYSQYKVSGLPWIEKIPVHWETGRAKWLFRKMQRPVQPSDEIVTCFRDGVVTLRKNRRTSGFTESLKEIGYQGVLRGDLVIHAMDAFAGAVGVSDSDGKCTPVYAVCQPIGEANPYYYAHIIREMARTQWILALARGIRERSTDFRFDSFATQVVPIPPPEEQLAIVSFLKYTDQQTNRLVNIYRQLVGASRSATERNSSLLFEYRTRLISDVVTGQLDVRNVTLPTGDEIGGLDEAIVDNVMEPGEELELVEEGINAND